MPLINRLLPDEADRANPDFPGKIPVHAFLGAMVMWEIGSWTRAVVIARMGLQDTAEWDDLTQLDQLRAQYDARPDAQQKAIFFSRFESLLILSERHDGEFLTRTEVLAEVGDI